MSDAPDHLGEAGGRSRFGVLRALVLPLGLLAVILGGLWYLDNRDSGGIDDAYGAVELPADRNPTDQGPAPEIGRVGPDFVLEQPGGGTVRLSDLQGRPVILNFWASWCEPCRAEMPELVAAYEEHGGQDLEVLAVNLQETDSRVLDFAEEFGLEFPLAIDRDGELRDTWRLGGPFDGIPTTYFIDEIGIVRDSVFGPLSEEMLEERIALLLEGTGA